MSTLHHLTDRTKVPPEQMTSRARAYLTVVAVRNVAMALAAFFLADRFSGPAFYYILLRVPVSWWGFLFAGIGVAATAAALLGSEPLARLSLTLSAMSMGAWAGGFIAASVWPHGPLISGPTGMILAVAVTAKDLIVCRQPIRSPFERVIRQLKARASLEA